MYDINLRGRRYSGKDMEEIYIVGVDIGSSKVSATIGKIEKQGTLTILDSVAKESQDIRNGEVIDIHNLSDALKSCISELENLVNLSIDEVYLGIPAGICRILEGKGVFTLPKENIKIEEKDVEKALEFSKSISIPNDEEIIDIIPYRYKVDENEDIENPIGMVGSKLEADTKLVVVKRSVISSRIKILDNIGLKIKALLIQAESSKDLYNSSTYSTGNVLIIDTGANNSDVAYYEKGILTDTFQIPLGGNIITKDIAFCTNTDINDAENLKKKDGKLIKEQEDDKEIKNGLENKDVVEQIVSARVEEILSFIHKETEERGYKDKIDNIVLLGGGISLFKGAKEFTHRVMNKSVYILQPYEILNKPLTINSLSIVKNVYNELKLDYRVVENVEEDFEFKSTRRNRKKKQ